MASGSSAKVIRAPGRVVLDPTDVYDTGAFPYGGTEIGRTSACRLEPLGASYRVEYESLGEAGDILEPETRWLFTCFLRGWDDDALKLLFPKQYTAGDLTQHAVFAAPGTSTPGETALDRSVHLLYVPDNVDDVPAVSIYKGIPDWDAGAEVALSRSEDFGIPLAVDCVRNTNGNILRVGRLVDLPLR